MRGSRPRGSRSSGNRGSCRCGRSPTLTKRLRLLLLALSLGLVGFDLGLDAFLGLEVVELLLALLGGFFDLFLTGELLLQVLRLLGSLALDLL